MAKRALIRIKHSKPNPYSKETRPTVVMDWRLQDLGPLPGLLIQPDGDDWMRLPSKTEPGDVFDIVTIKPDKPFLTPTQGDTLLPTLRVIVDDDLHVYLLATD